MHEINEVLEVWRSHFARLGKEDDSPNFDQNHFKNVTSFIKTYNTGNHIADTFLIDPFTVEEIRKATASGSICR